MAIKPWPKVVGHGTMAPWRHRHERVRPLKVLQAQAEMKRAAAAAEKLSLGALGRRHGEHGNLVVGCA